MAWDTEAQKLAAKAIGTVESSLRYDAINYNDPITVGAFQWYGTRAAAVLCRMRDENPGSWTGVAASIAADLSSVASSSSWWTGRELTRAEGESLKPVLFANQPIQNNQAIADFEAYRAVYERQGGNATSNTDAMIFFMCMYHQSPARSLDVLRAAGPYANMDRLYSVCLNNAILGQYRTRYSTARTIIAAHDTSGINLGGTVGTGPIEEADGGDPATSDETRNPLTGMSHIKRVGSHMHIVFTDGHTLICPSSGSDLWMIPGDDAQGTGVPGITPPPTDGTSVTGDTPGNKALAWMLANQESWAYSQAAGRMDPFTSGYTDCSACVRLAYLKTSNIDIGGYTTPQSQFGKLVTTDRNAIGNGTGLLPGDLIFYRNYVRAGWPYNHVEMYTGDAEKHTIGQVGSTAPGPSIHPMSRYLDWGHLAVMARRPW